MSPRKRSAASDNHESGQGIALKPKPGTAAKLAKALKIKPEDLVPLS